MAERFRKTSVAVATGMRTPTAPRGQARWRSRLGPPCSAIASRSTPASISMCADSPPLGVGVEGYLPDMVLASHHVKVVVVASLALRRHLAGLRPSELHPIYPAMVMGTGSLSTG